MSPGGFTNKHQRRAAAAAVRDLGFGSTQLKQALEEVAADDPESGAARFAAGVVENNVDAQTGVRLKQGFAANTNPQNRQALLTAVSVGDGAAAGSTAGVVNNLLGNAKGKALSGATRSALEHGRQLRAGAAGALWVRPARRERADAFASTCRDIIEQIWVEHSAASPLAEHASIKEPSKRGGEGKPGLICTYGSDWIARQLHEDSNKQAVLQQRGVKRRQPRQKYVITQQQVAKHRPWWVITPPPERIDFCVCRPCNEPRQLWLATVAHRKTHHGPGSECKCDCAACRPSGETSCQLSHLEPDIKRFVRTHYLCEEQDVVFDAGNPPDIEPITAKLPRLACALGECNRAGWMVALPRFRLSTGMAGFLL